MIGNIRRTNEILKKYNLRAKKNYGQNFLIDENILRKIISISKLTQEDGVIEIGPGIGALTEHLLIHSKKVLAYEIDPNMVKVLKEEIKNPNLKVINQDFLKADLENDLNYFSDCHRILVISNLPYYVTTPILFRLLSDTDAISEFYFMVQKEVAFRLTSKPNSKDYNSLSVLMMYKTDSEIAFEVSRNCFIPVPNVDSSVVRIVRKKIDLGIANEKKFLEFIQNIFAQRRKTLVNNIASKYNISKEKIEESLKSLEIESNARSESLTLFQISDIYKIIFESPN